MLSKILVQLASDDSDYNIILENVGLFLNTFVEKDHGKTRETHVIELSDGDTTIYITPI